MTIIAVGLNHRTAPLDVRERLAVPPNQHAEELERLAEAVRFEEVMLLSTCNRVEVYGVRHDDEPAGIIDALARLRGLPSTEFQGKYFARAGAGAVRHIFRVAASLESMVVGEPQILGQVKEAYRVAQKSGRLGTTLDRCMTMAFRGAKRVRNETDIARGAASVPSVAVDLATSIFGAPRGARVAVLGAGKMAEQAALSLREAGATDITVVNRNEERGRALAAAVGGIWVPWEHLDETLARVEVLVTSTASREPVLDARRVKAAMKTRRGAPLFIVDIAVPRDVARDVTRIDQVFVYDIDDLQKIVAENLHLRGSHAAAALRLVDEEVDAFLRWQRTRDVAPIITRLQQRGQSVMDGELAKTLPKLGGLHDEQRRAVEAMARAIVNKMLHPPINALRDAASEGVGADSLSDAAHRLHGLGEDGDGDDPASASGQDDPE